MEPLVRLARPDDAGGVARVHVAAWRAAYRGIMADDFLDGLDAEERELQWRGYLAERAGEGRELWVAEDGAAIAGFAALGPDPESRAAGEVYALYLLPERWGKGLGRRLWRAALGDLAARGYEEAVVWVLERNRRARDFYERQGFRADGGEKAIALGGASLTELRYRGAPGR